MGLHFGMAMAPCPKKPSTTDDGAHPERAIGVSRVLTGDYSSSFTAIFKYVLPPLWLAIAGYWVIEMFAHPEQVAFRGVPGGAPPAVKWFALAFALGGAVLFISLAWKLRWFRVHGDTLIVSDLFQTDEIPLRAVQKVSPWPLRPLVLRIAYRDASGRPRTAWFMPAFDWPSGNPSDPAFLAALRERVRAARPDVHSQP
jgi:hypothetical protein